MKKFIVAIAVLAMFAGTAQAAGDWDFYGSARVSTFYSNTDVNPTVAVPAGVSGDTVYAQGVQANSRIGANVKVSDELSGRFEYGTGVNVRLLYGVWNFGAGSLLAGQDYTPIRFPGSNQTYATDNGLGGWGELGSSRAAQLKLRFGAFQIAAVAPTSTYALNTTNNAVNVTAGTELTMPSIQAKYIFSGDNWQVGVAAGYQTFDIEIGVFSDDVASYVLGVGGSVNLGALSFGANVHGGQNAGNISSVGVNNTLIAAAGQNDGMAFYNAATGTFTDNESFGFKMTAAYAVNDMIGLELGYGQMTTEYDNVVGSDDDVVAYYFQAPITLAPGVVVVPEIGMIDYKEAGQQEIAYFGAKWQINF